MMDYYLSFKGEISMSKDIFDDLMENELRFLWLNCCVPKTPLELLVCSSKSFSLCSAKF